MCSFQDYASLDCLITLDKLLILRPFAVLQVIDIMRQERFSCVKGNSEAWDE